MSHDLSQRPDHNMFFSDKPHINIKYSLFMICLFLVLECCISAVEKDRHDRYDHISLGPVYEFVCVSFRTGNLNCFRVK